MMDVGRRVAIVTAALVATTVASPPGPAVAAGVPSLSVFAWQGAPGGLPAVQILPLRASGGSNTAAAGASRQLDSANWGGFIDGAQETGSGPTSDGAQFAQAASAWRTPALWPTAGAGSVSSSWVGIGGVFGQTLLQAGTTGYMGPAGAGYFAFVEDYPNPGLSINAPLAPGDAITVTLGQESGVWYVDVTDVTSGWTTGPLDVAATYQALGYPFYPPDQSSAEWILEDPTCAGALCPFAATTPQVFTSMQDTVVTPIRRSPLKTVLVDAQGRPLLVVAPGRIGKATGATATFRPFAAVRLPQATGVG